MELFGTLQGSLQFKTILEYPTSFYVQAYVWTRIFHVCPHSIGETRFLFVKN